MRELDPDTWLMLGITWFHGLLCGYANPIPEKVLL